MMLSMFVNDRRDNWSELQNVLSFVMHAYHTSVHESTGYSPFCLMMGEECSLPQDVSTDELRTNREHNVAPHPFATWVRDALHRTAARWKRIYDVKAVNRKFPVGSWVLRYYPPAAQKKLGSPWVGPQQVVRQATGQTVGIQKGPDDLKLCPAPVMWVGPHNRRQRNHYVLVQWPFDRVLISVSLFLLPRWTCRLGAILTHLYLVLTFTLNWTTPLI